MQVRILQLGQRVISHATLDGATLGRVLAEVGLSPPPRGVDIRVNGRAAGDDNTLADGDVVTLIPRIKGG